MYTNKELKDIYLNLKKGKVIKEEIKDIEKELLFIISKVEFREILMIEDLIKILFILKKENKLDIINHELIDFVKQLNDTSFIPYILNGITYTNGRLGSNILENEDIIQKLSFSFYEVYKILEKNYYNFNYINKINNVYCNVLIKYIDLKNKLLVKNYNAIDMYILSIVLELISTFVYINIDDFNYDYNLINVCMNEIEDNILEYFSYFIFNDLWCYNVGLVPKSKGGFKREFIVIGNIVNRIYCKQKKLKMNL